MTQLQVSAIGEIVMSAENTFIATMDVPQKKKGEMSRRPALSCDKRPAEGAGGPGILLSCSSLGDSPEVDRSPEQIRYWKPK